MTQKPYVVIQCFLLTENIEKWLLELREEGLEFISVCRGDVFIFKNLKYHEESDSL